MTNVMRTVGYVPGVLTLILMQVRVLWQCSSPGRSQTIPWWLACGACDCRPQLVHFLRFQGSRALPPPLRILGVALHRPGAVLRLLGSGGYYRYVSLGSSSPQLPCPFG